jgi:hypothetical protein
VLYLLCETTCPLLTPPPPPPPPRVLPLLLQVLFYVRLVGDIAGRVVPRRLQVSTVPPLLLLGLGKAAMMPLIFVSIFRPEMMMGDLGAVLLIGVFWVLSG